MIGQQTPDAAVLAHPLFQKKVLTVDELSIYSGLKKAYLYKLMHLKKIPGASRPIGKKLFFDREVIDAWLLGTPQLTREQLELRAETYLSTGKL